MNDFGIAPTYPLTISRNRGWYGKVRALHVFAKTPSGTVRLGKVSQGKILQVNVPREATRIYGKMDWGKSEPMDLTFVNPNETIYANAWFSINPLRIFGIWALPIRLESRPR